jgi:hypothetical protein
MGEGDGGGGEGMVAVGDVLQQLERPGNRTRCSGPADVYPAAVASCMLMWGLLASIDPHILARVHGR